MIRTLLTTTALAALLATGAIAQDAPATTEAPATEAPAADAEAPTADAQSTGEATLLAEGYMVVDSDNLASRIIGAAVYASAADDAEHIGDVNDLVVNENGDVAAVIIGVGGFLGIGEKNIAVDYTELEWTVAADNTERFVLNTTRENLEAAAEFEWRDDEPTDAAPAADGDAMAPADDAMAPADGAAFDRQAMQEIDPAALTADDLTGTNVYGPQDEHIGTIGDFVLGEGDTIDAVIVDFGGFLGIGVKQVAVAYESLQFLADANDNMVATLNVTREQMEQAPEFNRDTYAAERDTQRLVLQ